MRFTKVLFKNFLLLELHRIVDIKQLQFCFVVRGLVCAIELIKTISEKLLSMVDCVRNELCARLLPSSSAAVQYLDRRGCRLGLFIFSHCCCYNERDLTNTICCLVEHYQYRMSLLLRE